MDEQKKGWKQFQKLRFDSRRLSRSARQAEKATVRHAHRFILKRLTNLRDIRNHVTLWLVLVVALAGAIVAQLAWYQGSYSTTAPTAGGTYAEAVKGTVDTLNPLYARTDAEMTARTLLFAGLLDYDKTGKLRNDLAESMRVDSTKRVYTLQLKPDLVWSDGTKLTAADVVFTANLMKNPEARAVMAESWRDVTTRAIDERTVEFRLPAAYASFGDALTFAVLPQHILAEVEPSVLRESQFSVSPVGSGPFALRLSQKVAEGQPQAHKIIHMVANPSYHKAPIRLERFELHAYDNSSAMTTAVVARDVNAVLDAENAIDTSKLPKDFVVIKKPINNGVYALFNTSSPVLRDKALRKALLGGTDIQRLRTAGNADAPSLNVPFIPTQIGAPNTLSYLPAFNTKTANSQLTKLGWKKQADGSRKKKKQTLMLRVVARKDGGHATLLRELARQWKELGVSVQVTEFEQVPGGQSFVQSVLQPRAYDVLINELIIGADPDVFAYWHSSQAGAAGLNFSNYKSKLADDILVSARQRDESNLRNQKYRDFAKVWTNDAPAIPLYQSTIRYAHTEKTTAFSSNAVLSSPTSRLGDIEHWTSGRAQVYKTP